MLLVLNVLDDWNGWNVLNCFKAGAARALSGHDRPAPVRGTFHFVAFRFPVGDFLCRANRHPPSQSIEHGYILACRSEIPYAWEAELPENFGQFRRSGSKARISFEQDEDVSIAAEFQESRSFCDLIYLTGTVKNNLRLINHFFLRASFFSIFLAGSSHREFFLPEL